MFLQKWILNRQDLPQNQSLETVPVCIVLQCHPQNNIGYIHMCDECKINRFRRLSQALVHFLMDLASLFSDHRISGLIRAKFQHFRTIWDHTCDKSPTVFISSSLKWWSSMHGADTL